MKKTILFFVLLTAISFTATSQLKMTAREQAGQGAIKSDGQNNYSPSRSTPPGTLLYGNDFTCPPVNGLSSESGIPSETAVDFITTFDGTVDYVRWWFLIDQDMAATNWYVKIYSNSGCLPSAQLGAWIFTPMDVNYEAVCSAFGYTVYDCWVELPAGLNVQSGVTYWLSVQADVNPFASGFRGFWAAYGNGTQYKDCVAAFKSSYFNGNENWYDAPTATGQYEMAFEVYGSSQTSDVPVSDWAVILGIGLILTFVVLRFRRMA